MGSREPRILPLCVPRVLADVTGTFGDAREGSKFTLNKCCAPPRSFPICAPV